MDTIIFFLILCTLFAMVTGKRWLVLGLFFVTILSMLLLFNHHVTDTLNLSF